MRFVHTKCGGEIDVKKRQCVRCKKKWSPIAFKFDPTGIRPMVDSRGRLAPGGEDTKKLRKQYAPGKRSTAMVETFGHAYGREETLPKGKPYASWLGKVPRWLDLGLTRYLAGILPKWPRWARILVTVVLVVTIVVITLLVRR